MKPNYQLFTAMKWLIQSAVDKERTIRVWDKLAYEVLDAYKNEVCVYVFYFIALSLSWFIGYSGVLYQ